MRTYTYTNQYGDAIDFDFMKDYGISEITGLDSVTVNDTTTQGFRQDGNTLEYSQLEPRQVEIRFWIEAMSEQSYKAVRDLFFKAFRPKSNGTLFIKDDGVDVKLACHVTQTPEMPEDSLYTVLDGYVALEANDPLLVDSKESMTELTSWEGGFSCPTKFPFRCRHRGAPVVVLDNDGIVEIPVTIVFEGPAVNPIVRNLTTDQYIAINGTLTAGEKIIITTGYSDKSVTKVGSDGAETNGETWITDASDFIWLDVGKNQLKYGSDDTSQINAVSVYYRRAFTGV